MSWMSGVNNGWNQVTVDSHEGEGSCFQMRLAVKIAASPAPSEAEVSESA
jgi:hypothetical protein